MLRARVPATSANLGPGFDALGLALDLHLVVYANLADRDDFSYAGEGPAPRLHGNLVHHGFAAVYRAVGEAVPPVSFTVENPIPLARGLGSSSAALVAGAAIADALLEHPLGRDGVFQLTAGIEGHPDNVGPAVYGGLTVAAADARGEFLATSLRLPERWSLLFGVPDFELPTPTARAALPSSYSRSDTVLTSSRSALWVAAVANDQPELLRAASLDVLHEPYRAALVPRLAVTTARLREVGVYAAFLSGAGPSVGVVAPPELLEACRAVLAEFAPGGQVLALASAGGYVLERA